MENFNLDEVKRILGNSPELDRSYLNEEQKVFNTAKSRLLDQFTQHPITQELLGGIEASNISGTLGGVGNLFSFIGFPTGYNPIGPLQEILTGKLVLSNPTKAQTSDGLLYKFPVYIPTDEIYEASPLPFEVGNSWVSGIEQGISGFSNFLYIASKASRSGKGIETSHIVRGGEFSTQPYLLSMLRGFMEELGGSFTFDL